MEMTHSPSGLTGLPRGSRCSMKHGGSPSGASQVRGQGCYLCDSFPGAEEIESHRTPLAEKRKVQKKLRGCLPPLSEFHPLSSLQIPEADPGGTLGKI